MHDKNDSNTEIDRNDWDVQFDQPKPSKELVKRINDLSPPEDEFEDVDTGTAPVEPKTHGLKRK